MFFHARDSPPKVTGKETAWLREQNLSHAKLRGHTNSNAGAR